MLDVTIKLKDEKHNQINLICNDITFNKDGDIFYTTTDNTITTMIPRENILCVITSRIEEKMA